MKTVEISNSGDGKWQMTSATEQSNEDGNNINWQKWKKVDDIGRRTER